MWLIQKEKVIIFTSSNVGEEKCTHFCNYYRSEEKIKQYYTIYHEKDLENTEVNKLDKGILRTFYVNHKIATFEGYVAMYARARLENEIHDKKLNEIELAKYRKMRNNDLLKTLKKDKTYINEFLKEGNKSYKDQSYSENDN